uniref:Uncharacterized protein n=1 Tax=Vespula pensylvanica TaxID=30213 RepID=A0A834PFM5_VESPE|nr:hypothetical protein H0235_001168 [Vespula pensylvanica]
MFLLKKPPACGKMLKYLKAFVNSPFFCKRSSSSPISNCSLYSADRISRFSILKTLISRKLKLNIENKLLIYKIVIKPIWTYGIQLWGIAIKSHYS